MTTENAGRVKFLLVEFLVVMRLWKIQEPCLPKADTVMKTVKGMFSFPDFRSQPVSAGTGHDVENPKYGLATSRL